MAFRFPEKSSQHTAELCSLAPQASPGRAPSGGCHASVPGRGQLARLRRRGAEYYVEEAREEGLEASPLRQ